MFRRRRGNKVWNLIFGALVAAAIAQELQKPSPIRRWHGQLLFFIPYDFRVAPLTRVKESVWSPEDDRILMPMAFGVGWSVNIGRIVRTINEK